MQGWRLGTRERIEMLSFKCQESGGVKLEDSRAETM